MKVIVTLPVVPDVQAYLEAQVDEGVELVFAGDCAEDELAARGRGAVVIVGTRALEPLLAVCPEAKLVQVPWAGVGRLAEIARAHPGLRVANSHANAYVTAQYAAALVLAVVTRLVPGHDLIRRGGWAEREALEPPVTLAGKTVGVLGAGRIGRCAAGLLAPFGARIVGLRRTVEQLVQHPVPPPFEAMHGPADLHAFLAETDVLLITLPGTAATFHLIGRAEIDLLGAEGYLVNVGRGSVVDEAALFEALRDGRLAGAGLDVWTDYHPEPDEEGRAFPYRRPFHELDNVVLSPHRAGAMPANPEAWAVVAENINRVAAGRTDLLNLVDRDAGY